MKKVITYGSFDLFHKGHYKLLERAKALGDYLIVGVTTDSYDISRGKLNIIDSVLDRVENVRKTGLADKIILEDHVGQKAEDIQKYGVDILTVGSDWTGKFDSYKNLCDVVYLERTKDISSTFLRNTKFPLVSIGIIGSGRIAHRFASEVKFVSGTNVIGNYNPHIESAELFAKVMELDFYTSNLDQLFERCNAVYIATPHETHYEYTKKALLAGKHVLCEKPFVLEKAQAEELFDLAKEKQLVLMEAIKTAYCPGFLQMMNIARSGVIGDIVDVEACFTKLNSPAESRELTNKDYGGSFTEMGSYNALPIVKLLGKDFERIHFHSIKAENGIDLYTRALIKYKNCMGTIKVGLGVKAEGQLIISGTKGYIIAKSPWWLTKSFQVRYEDPDKTDNYENVFLGNGLRYEICEFVKSVNGFTDKNFKLSRGESIAIAGIMEEFLKKRKYNGL